MYMYMPVFYAPWLYHIRSYTYIYLFKKKTLTRFGAVVLYIFVSYMYSEDRCYLSTITSRCDCSMVLIHWTVLLPKLYKSGWTSCIFAYSGKNKGKKLSRVCCIIYIQHYTSEIKHSYINDVSMINFCLAISLTFMWFLKCSSFCGDKNVKYI